MENEIETTIKHRALVEKLLSHKLSYLKEFNVYYDGDESVYREQNYQVTERIGCGTFGEVMRVKDTSKEYAGMEQVLKIIPLSNDKSKDKKILREVILMEKIRHKHLVDFYAYVITIDEAIQSSKLIIKLHLFMQPCDENLEQWMKMNNSNSNRNIDECAQMILGISFGLQYLHQRKIIHRDLKPQNILVLNHYKPTLCLIGDFGLSTLHSERLESFINLHSFGLGTPMYVAPEQLKYRKYNNSVDIYSLGCIWMELTANIKDNSEAREALLYMKQERILPSIFQTSKEYVENGKLILKMTEEDHEVRPNINKVIDFIQKCDCGKIEYFDSYGLKKFKAGKILIQVLIGASDTFGKVYKCHFKSKKQGKYVLRALKVIEFVEERKVVFDKLLARLFLIDKQRHENLVKFKTPQIEINRLKANIKFYFFSELCVESLREWHERNISENIIPDKRESLRIMYEIAYALFQLHNQGITHSNLKPSNILIGFDGRWKISDMAFSFLRFMQFDTEDEYYSSLQERKNVAKIYAAPEQLKPHNQSKLDDHLKLKSEHKTDIFSLGKIFSECFQGLELAQMDNLIESMIKNSPAERPSIEDVCEKIMNTLKSQQLTVKNFDSYLSEFKFQFPKSFGKYKIKKITDGLFCEIFKLSMDFNGKSSEMNHFALKKYHLESNQENAIEKVLNEVAIQWSVHRYIPEIYKNNELNICWVENWKPNSVDLFYIDILCVENLADWFARKIAEKEPNKCITFDDFLDVIIKILKALSWSHAGGFGHRNIKPTNIIRKSNGEWIFDVAGKHSFWSLKYKTEGEYYRSLGKNGVKLYAAPEQFKSTLIEYKDSELAVDIYSLGVIFIEYLQQINEHIDTFFTFGVQSIVVKNSSTSKRLIGKYKNLIGKIINTICRMTSPISSEREKLYFIIKELNEKQKKIRKINGKIFKLSTGNSQLGHTNARK